MCTGLLPPGANPIAVKILIIIIIIKAGPGGRAVCSVGLRPFTCWDCGFEYCRGVDFFLMRVSCVRFRLLRRADRLFRRILPNAVCL